MSTDPHLLILPTSIMKAAAELARIDGVSLNQFIAAAVEEKVGVLRRADEFLKKRAGKSNPQDLVRYLRAAPNVPPTEGGARLD